MSYRFPDRRAVLTALALFCAGLAPTALTAQEEDALTLVDLGDGARAVFTLDELGAFPQMEVRTGNEFVDGIRAFSGPRLFDVISTLGPVESEEIRLFAANDYEVRIPLDDLRRYDVILATSMDGVPLSRRNKGPLWVIYPMSDHPELTDSVYNSRLIWQVVRIEIP